ncbi:MAG: CoA-binding protein [Bacteroidales bacterium]
MKSVVVLGASANPDRYSNKAVRSLLKRGYHVIPVGRQEGLIENLPILTCMPDIENVHTVLMYISQANQLEYYDYILKLKPKRIIFNPGTENYDFGLKASRHNIECVYDCALIMLSTKTF